MALRRDGDIDWTDLSLKVLIKGQWVAVSELAPEQIYAVVDSLKQRAAIGFRQAVTKALVDGLSAEELREIIAAEVASRES